MLQISWIINKLVWFMCFYSWFYNFMHFIEGTSVAPLPSEYMDHVGYCPRSSHNKVTYPVANMGDDTADILLWYKQSSLKMKKTGASTMKKYYRWVSFSSFVVPRRYLRPQRKRSSLRLPNEDSHGFEPQKRAQTLDLFSFFFVGEPSLKPLFSYCRGVYLLLVLGLLW